MDPAPYASAPARLAGLPSRLLAQAALRGGRLVDAALAEHGLRKHHFAVLIALEEAGPASQADLGRRLAIDRSDMAAAVTHLELVAAVVRERDEHDRRRNVVCLTPAGTRLLANVERRVHDAQTTLLEPLSEVERGKLVALLRRLAAHAARGG